MEFDGDRKIIFLVRDDVLDGIVIPAGWQIDARGDNIVIKDCVFE